MPEQPAPRDRWEPAWWGALVALWAGFSWPVWGRLGLQLGGDTGDPVSARYYYHYVAEVVAGRLSAEVLGPLGHPAPKPRGAEFPTLVEGLAGVPFHLLLEPPLDFRATMALALLVNAVGAAVLGRALGARGPGLLVAGGLGLTAAPALVELAQGRPNALWIGHVGLALGLLLHATAAGPGCPRPAPPLRPAAALAWLLVLPSVLLLAALSYPPHAALLAPLGAALLLVGWHRGMPPRLLLVAAAAGLALALGWGELQRLLEFRQRYAGGGDVPISPHEAFLRLESWLGRPLPGAPAGGLAGAVHPATWALAPLALLPRRGRAARALALLTSLAAALLALGEPLRLTAGLDLEQATGLSLRQPLAPFLALGGVFGYRARAAIGATLLTAALSGVALTALGRGHPARRALAAATGALALGLATHAALPCLHGALRPRAPEPLHAALQALPPGPVAVVPYMLSAELCSVRADPDRPRFHPYLERGQPRAGPPLLTWLDAIGWGAPPAPVPDAAARRALPPSWVLLDPSRCRPGGPSLYPDCDPAEVEARVAAVLGPATPREDGVRVWRLDLPEGEAP